MIAGLAYPRPALHRGDVCLRPWRAGDRDALAAAWNDSLIQENCGVPADRAPTNAGHWIRGHEGRVEQGLALDLVITDQAGGAVKGEVGFGPFDHVRKAAVIGFWIAADHRRSGVASAAVAVATEWIFGQGIASVLAQTRPANVGSVAVLRVCGFVLLDDGARSPDDDARLQTWVRYTDVRNPDVQSGPDGNL